MIVSQPQQPANNGRSDYAIRAEIAQLDRAMHSILVNAMRDYDALHDRQAYDYAELEQNEARRREQFDWPAPSTTLVAPPRQRSYNLHASITPHVAGRMRIVEQATAKEQADWERKHG